MNRLKSIHTKIEYDNLSVLFFIFLLLIQFLFPNNIYNIIGISIIYILINKIQIPHKSSIFSLHLFYHMMQIMSGVWLCNYLEVDLTYKSQFTPWATLVSYAGVIFIYIPIIYFQNKVPNYSLEKIRNWSLELSTKRTMELYIIFFFITNSLALIAFSYSGLTQIIVSCKNFKWFIFSLLGFQVFLKKELLFPFILIVIAEFSLGLLSFFSDFKTVVFYLIVIALFFITTIKIKHIIVFVILVSIGLFIGIKWTAIKGDYRSYLNKGKKTQTVDVDKNSAYNKLLELSAAQTNVDKTTLELLDRLQYTYHLAKTMERVPSVIQYENGGNLAGIFKYVFTPRYLNPDKEVNQASKKATKYTGIGYLGIESGVSFSLGYFADCYIDFGYFGMMIPLLLLGIIYGYSYYYFISKTTNNYLINVTYVSAIFMELIYFESDGTFLLGRLFSNLFTFFLFKIILLPTIQNFIKSNRFA